MRVEDGDVEVIYEFVALREPVGHHLHEERFEGTTRILVMRAVVLVQLSCCHQQHSLGDLITVAWRVEEAAVARHLVPSLQEVVPEGIVVHRD